MYCKQPRKSHAQRFQHLRTACAVLSNDMGAAVHVLDNAPMVAAAAVGFLSHAALVSVNLSGLSWLLVTCSIGVCSGFSPSGYAYMSA